MCRAANVPRAVVLAETCANPFDEGRWHEATLADKDNLNEER
jgi:hypothetical protein